MMLPALVPRPSGWSRAFFGLQNISTHFFMFCFVFATYVVYIICGLYRVQDFIFSSNSRRISSGSLELIGSLTATALLL